VSSTIKLHLFDKFQKMKNNVHFLIATKDQNPFVLIRYISISVRYHWKLLCSRQYVVDDAKPSLLLEYLIYPIGAPSDHAPSSAHQFKFSCREGAGAGAGSRLPSRHVTYVHDNVRGIPTVPGPRRMARGGNGEGHAQGTGDSSDRMNIQGSPSRR